MSIQVQCPWCDYRSMSEDGERGQYSRADYRPCDHLLWALEIARSVVPPAPSSPKEPMK